MEISTKNNITTIEAAKILGCSRGNIDRLVLKGYLEPIPTVFPKLYFDRAQVLKYKSNSKKFLK